MNLPLIVNLIYSIIAFKVTKRLIPRLRDMFINANLFGNDLNKFDKPKIPEAMGVVSGCIFLVTLFFFIPIPFGKILFNEHDEIFPHDEFVELIASMLSICCMLLLGFADDVLNLKWRHKLLLPTIATLPLLMVYYVNFNSTTIIMPHFIRYLIGTSVDIGFLYYIFMGMLAVFCTNAINILAGINGLEVGQSLVIAASIIMFNIIELLTNLDTYKGHLLSLYFILPYFGTSVGLWMHNRYPSSVFVGDTFCYLSGMTFAVVGILGHFSKTLLLFFIPQVFNFLYSIPQLFHFVPCPRHRMPKYNAKTKLLDPSKTIINCNELPLLGRFFIKLFDKFYLLSMEKINKDSAYINNLTLINLILVLFGAKHEKHLTYILICLQIFCTIIAFTIRYPLAKYFYG